MTRSDLDRLNDILERIQRIKVAQEYLKSSDISDDSELGEVALDAILHSLIIIGEASKNLSIGVKERNPEVAWREVVRMRDKLAHHYHHIQAAVIHDLLDEPINSLEKACRLELKG